MIWMIYKTNDCGIDLLRMEGLGPVSAALAERRLFSSAETAVFSDRSAFPVLTLGKTLFAVYWTASGGPERDFTFGFTFRADSFCEASLGKSIFPLASITPERTFKSPGRLAIFFSLCGPLAGLGNQGIQFLLQKTQLLLNFTERS
jgi:hypothetical protein